MKEGRSKKREEMERWGGGVRKEKRRMGVRLEGREE